MFLKEDNKINNLFYKEYKKSEKKLIKLMKKSIIKFNMPRSLCDKKNLEKKKKAFLDLRTTNHYSCKIKLF
jgi:hypothetical protein